MIILILIWRKTSRWSCKVFISCLWKESCRVPFFCTSTTIGWLKVSRQILNQSEAKKSRARFPPWAPAARFFLRVLNDLFGDKLSLFSIVISLNKLFEVENENISVVFFLFQSEMNGKSIDAIADHAVSTVTRTLQFVLMLEKWRPSCLRHVSMASRIARLMCVFLTGIEVRPLPCVFVMNFHFLFRIDSVNVFLVFLSQEMTCFWTAKFAIIYQPFYGFIRVPQDKTSLILALQFLDSPLSMICKFTASLFFWVIFYALVHKVPNSIPGSHILVSTSFHSV